MSYVVRNQYGAFCSVCQSPLGLEEDDWDTCDACGGEGFGEEDDFAGYDPDDDGIEPTYVSRPAPPELRKVLADALAAPPPDPQPPGAEMTTTLNRFRELINGLAELYPDATVDFVYPKNHAGRKSSVCTSYYSVKAADRNTLDRGYIRIYLDYADTLRGQPADNTQEPK